VINVLDAENEVSNAQINYTAAAYDERVAVFQVLLAMGRLSPQYLGIEG
jgi:adhesin transport system outer membrane protein